MTLSKWDREIGVMLAAGVRVFRRSDSVPVQAFELSPPICRPAASRDIKEALFVEEDAPGVVVFDSMVVSALSTQLI